MARKSVASLRSASSSMLSRSTHHASPCCCASTSTPRRLGNTCSATTRASPARSSCCTGFDGSKDHRRRLITTHGSSSTLTTADRPSFTTSLVRTSRHIMTDRTNLSAKIEVLDHGFVRLVDHMGSDVSITRAARVSFDGAWRAGEDAGSDARLIRYLWKHQHASPFEAAEFQFEVKAPIFVFRQWMRQRTWSYNELSARYRELPEEFYVPAPDQVGAQSTSSRQARVAAESDENLAGSDPCRLRERVRRLSRPSTAWRAARAGALRFAKVDLRNLFHFLTLRCDAHAQYEIR